MAIHKLEPNSACFTGVDASVGINPQELSVPVSLCLSAHAVLRHSLASPR